MIINRNLWGLLACLTVSLGFWLGSAPAARWVAAQGVVTQDEAKSQDEEAPVMVLEVTLKRPAQARGYRKPYVAVWIEDKDGFPVRTLALWVQKNPPGPRWIPDLRQWSRADRLRQIVDDEDLVDSISGATRGVGTYKIAWDGQDGQRKPLSPGKYTLMIEVVREHGTHQLVKHPFEHGGKAREETLEGNVEIQEIKVQYLGTRSS